MVVAPNLRRFKSARGTAIVMPEVISVPDARYWPGGVIPEGLTPLLPATGVYAGRLDWLNAQNEAHVAEFKAAQPRKAAEREAAERARAAEWAARYAQCEAERQARVQEAQEAIDRLQAEHDALEAA
jgi:hypothetical protein